MSVVLLEPEFGQQAEFDEQVFRCRELLDTLNRLVHERTNRMIGDLRIDVSKSEITLWGRTRAYYYKQLASQAVLAELTGFEVVNEIQVI
ncbi:MAG: hypothetical protein JWM11_633 [Planctomycetaceae bacterium]|nr:hypothetical protein [Planctomycetaceae bacterium]